MVGDRPETTAFDHLTAWRPHGGESNVHDYRESIAAQLERRVDAASNGNEPAVAVDRGAATPDVTVGTGVGICIEPAVTESGQGRLRTRLDRFTGAYERLLVVAIDVQDESAWSRLQQDYATTDGTTFDFIVAPAPDPSRQSSGDGASGDDATTAPAGDSSEGRFNTDPPAAEPPSLRALVTSGVGVVFWLAVLGVVGSALFVFYSWTDPTVSAAWVSRAKTVLIGSFVVAGGIIRLATNGSLRG